VTIAHSEGAADEIEAVCGQRPMRVLPYGFDPADFSLCSEQERQAARSTHGISPDAVVIGTSGKGTNQRKNVPLLLKSLSSLDRSRPVELVITGKGWDQHLPALAELVDGVHYVEASDAAELRSCYAAMDLYACTSSVEGGPLPLLEAAACGTPFVSTDVGHAKEILSTCREAGTVACAEQYDTALQAELSRHRTPDRSREVAGAAAAREWTEVVGKYEALYGEVSQRHSSDPVRSLLALERTVSLNYVRVRLARTQNRGSQRK
jgi:glycosyltransferase involved in cell wall biosynthesis